MITAEAAEAADDETADMAKLSVLVVDDDQDACDNLSEILQLDGCRTTFVQDPTTALDAVRAGNHHLCILDLNMPKLSGLDLLRQIRRIDADVAVVILTGYPSVESATASIEYEVSGYFVKPFSIDDFRAVVQRIAKKKGLVLRREEVLHLTIGKRIRDLRKQRALTLKQMARRAQLSVSLLSQIERAESSASVSSLFKIANALDVRLTELFGDF